jgi:hypothetical protein
MDLARILLAGSVAVILASLVFGVLAAIGTSAGLWAMVAATPIVRAAAGPRHRHDHGARQMRADGPL